MKSLIISFEMVDLWAMGLAIVMCINSLLMWLLQVIAEYLQKIDPKSDGAKRDWVAIYDECASVLYQV